MKIDNTSFTALYLPQNTRETLQKVLKKMDSSTISGDYRNLFMEKCNILTTVKAIDYKNSCGAIIDKTPRDAMPIAKVNRETSLVFSNELQASVDNSTGEILALKTATVMEPKTIYEQITSILENIFHNFENQKMVEKDSYTTVRKWLDHIKN